MVKTTAVLVALGTFVWSTSFACHENPRCSSQGIEYACDRCLTPDGDDTCGASTTDHCGTLRCENDLDVWCDTDDDCAAVGGHCNIDGVDGVFVICGSTDVDDTDDTLNGTSGVDLLCGFGGDDVIDGKAGNDSLEGGDGTDTLLGGTGDDWIAALGSAGGGDDYIDGGGGNDTLLGSSGDNVIFGRDGNDLIISGSGRDVIKAGDGNDPFVSTTVYGAPLLPDDVVGTLICGGTGNDNLYGYGPSHQCMDGGAGTDSCNYAFGSTGTQSAEDVGTGRNCETGGTARAPSCGCEE